MALHCWFVLCFYHYSVALAVDGPEMSNRIAETFISKAPMRFVILLWGAKSSLACDGLEGMPAFNYKEIVDLGQERRKSLLNSHDASKSIRWVWTKLTYVLYLRTLLTAAITCIVGLKVHMKAVSLEILLWLGFPRDELNSWNLGCVDQMEVLISINKLDEFIVTLMERACTRFKKWRDRKKKKKRVDV